MTRRQRGEPDLPPGPARDLVDMFRLLRRKAGLTNDQIAGRARLSSSHVSEVLSGWKAPSPDAAARIANVLGADSEGRRRVRTLAEQLAEVNRHHRRRARAPAPAVSTGPPRERPTCTLPSDSVAFTGRGNHLRDVAAEVSTAADAGRVVAIHAIDGMPGVGKTALAVRLGHLLAERFPDGQLFLDLYAHTAGQKPLAPAAALARLLAADGVETRHLPEELDDRMAMWRSRMAGRRALVVLDNAASSEQVTPLLPGAGQCLVLITSRRFLGDLPSGAVDVPLDVLAADESAQMFLRLAPRAAEVAGKVVALVELCGHLPLAISLLASVFVRHRSWTMDDLIRETRARLLTIAAEHRTVAAAFDLSYRYLTASEKRMFRCLGLHPGAEMDPYAAAALAGLPVDGAADLLDRLHSYRLLIEPQFRRYRMHDLIREYASSLASGDPAEEREPAFERLLDYYQRTAHTAAAHLARHNRPIPDGLPPAAPAMPELAMRAQSVAWLRTERTNVLACIERATSDRLLDRVVGLTAAVAPYLRVEGPWDQAVALHTAAAGAAHRLGDRPGEAAALTQLGVVWRLLGELPKAAEALQSALQIQRELDARLDQAIALHELGVVRRARGDLAGARATLEQAVDLYRRLDVQLGQANALNHLGATRRLTGDYSGAVATLQHALDIFRELGDQTGQVPAHTELGIIGRLTGDYPAAGTALKQAVELARELGDRNGLATALTQLGATRRATGDFAEAAAAIQQALDLYDELGARPGRANALKQIGLVRRATGDMPGAVAAVREAVEIFRDLGDRGGETEAHNQLGALYAELRDPLRSRDHHEQALQLAGALANPLEEARAWEGIGRADRAVGRIGAGTSALTHALEIYQRIGAAEASALSAEISATA